MNGVSYANYIKAIDTEHPNYSAHKKDIIEQVKNVLGDKNGQYMAAISSSHSQLPISVLPNALMKATENIGKGIFLNPSSGNRIANMYVKDEILCYEITIEDMCFSNNQICHGTVYGLTIYDEEKNSFVLQEINVSHANFEKMVMEGVCDYEQCITKEALTQHSIENRVVESQIEEVAIDSTVKNVGDEYITKSNDNNESIEKNKNIELTTKFSENLMVVNNSLASIVKNLSADHPFNTFSQKLNASKSALEKDKLKDKEASQLLTTLNEQKKNCEEAIKEVASKIHFLQSKRILNKIACILHFPIRFKDVENFDLIKDTLFKYSPK